MAKEEAKPKVVLERTYNVPLRKEFQKVPKYKRAKKAVTALRKFLKRHMKSDSIKIGRHLNEQIWQRGIKNPPHHVKISVVKDENGAVMAEIIGKPIFEEPPKEEKGKKGKKKEQAKEESKEEIKEESKKEEPKEEIAPEEKTEEQKEPRQEQNKEAGAVKENIRKEEPAKEQEKEKTKEEEKEKTEKAQDTEKEQNNP